MLKLITIGSLATLILAAHTYSSLLRVKQRVKDNDILIAALVLDNQKLEDQIAILQKRMRVLNGTLMVVPKGVNR